MKPNLGQLRRLVGNWEVYAVQNEDGSWTPKREKLTDEILLAHLQHRMTVGTYVGTPAAGLTVSRTLVFDVDEEDMAVALDKVTALRSAATALLVPESSMGIEFSGKKGYHLWLVVQDYVENRELRRLGRAVTALAGVQCEVFPKQDEVRDLGNLVKLPGGIHRVTGEPNNFLSVPPRPMTGRTLVNALENLPEEQQARRPHQGSNRFPCLAHISEGVAEGGRNTQMFHLATMFRRHGATDDVVEAILRHVNERNDPPLEEDELLKVLEGSSFSGPVCQQLPDSVQDACGEHCIKKSVGSKLYCLPGQVRHASEGEHVVLRVAEHVGNIVKLEHPDLETMKGPVRGH